MYNSFLFTVFFTLFFCIDQPIIHSISFLQENRIIIPVATFTFLHEAEQFKKKVFPGQDPVTSKKYFIHLPGHLQECCA